MKTTKKMIDYYERRAVNPALEVVRGCAKALNVPMIELLGSEDNNKGRKRRGTGPTGKMRRLFEAASQLPPQPTGEDYRPARTLHRPPRWTIVCALLSFL